MAAGGSGLPPGDKGNATDAPQVAPGGDSRRCDGSKGVRLACDHCGSVFEPYRGNQRFCSAACRFNAWETNNPRIRVETPELAELQRGQARRVRAALEGFRAGRPLTRGELCTATGLADRTIRAAIAYLVIREHVPVVHVRGGGYYIARDTESIDREMAQIGSRIRRLTERMDGYRKAKLELMGRAG